jgi:hypothetical protein
MTLNPALVNLLITKLIGSSNSLPHSLMQRRRKQMERRFFLERLRRSKLNIPHPIFFKKGADFAQFVEIWRSKKIAEMIPQMESGDSIYVSPNEIRGLRTKFDVLRNKREPFAIHFLANQESIVMKFEPVTTDDNNQTRLRVEIQKFNMEDCVCSSLPSLTFVPTIKNSTGVELTMKDSRIKVGFFYDPKVLIPFLVDSYDYFRAQSVRFYTESSLRSSRKSTSLSKSMERLCLAPLA